MSSWEIGFKNLDGPKYQLCPIDYQRPRKDINNKGTQSINRNRLILYHYTFLFILQFTFSGFINKRYAMHAQVFLLSMSLTL